MIKSFAGGNKATLAILFLIGERADDIPQSIAPILLRELDILNVELPAKKGENGLKEIFITHGWLIRYRDTSEGAENVELIPIKG